MKDWFVNEVRKAPRAYAIVLLVAVSFLAYANTLDAGFHYDDSHAIVNNPFLRDPGYMPDFFHRADMFSALPGHDMYRPVLLLSFAANHYLGGYDPLFWRLTAIALHALVAVGVYLLVHSLSKSTDQGPGSGGELGALVAALFFAVHPVFTETIDYASSRSSLLATAGVVWAMLAHRRALASPHRAARVPLLALSLVFFAAGFLSKEIAIVYPLLLAAIAWVERRGWMAVLPAVAVAVTLLVVRKMVLGSAVIDFAAREAALATADPGSGGARPILWNLFTQARVICIYLTMFLFPRGLSIEHDVRVSESLFEFGVIFGGLVILGLLVAAFRGRRSRPLLTIGLLWFFFALAPTSSIIPLNQVMNEHRLYLPGVGLAIVLAFGMRRLALAAPRLRLPVAVGGCLVLGALTLRRNEDWNDPVRIWESAVRVSPGSATAWNALGAQRRIHDDRDGAAVAFERSLEIDPEAWDATFNLGTLALQCGRDDDDDAALEEAARWLDRSLVLHPDAQRSLWYLAEVRYAQGRIEEARAEFQRLGSLSARMYEMSCYPLARIAMDEGELDLARGYYGDALEAGADPVSALLGLARLEAEAGNLKESLAKARRAIGERPHDARPYMFLAHLHAGTAQAPGYLIEAERRGYRPTESERTTILQGKES